MYLGFGLLVPRQGAARPALSVGPSGPAFGEKRVALTSSRTGKTEDRATQLAPMLSPRQLARLAVGFGEGQASQW